MAVVLVLVVLLLFCEAPAGELELIAESPVSELDGDLVAMLPPRWCMGE